MQSRNSTPGLRSPTPALQSQQGIVRPVKSRRQLRSSPNEAVLVQDELHKVSVAAQLPSEIQQIINASDLYSDYVNCQLFFSTNYGIATSKEYTYAWPILSVCLQKSFVCYALLMKILQRTASAQLYRFPCPLSVVGDIASSVYAPVPLSTIVEYGSNVREPGMLIVGLLGQIRYWSALSMAMTGIDQFSHAQIPLEKGEIIRHLHCVVAGCYILSISSSRLYRISLIAQGGRSSVTVSALTRSRGVLSRLGSTFLGSGIPLTASLGITALTSSSDSLSDGSRLLWVAKPKSFEAWKVYAEKAGDTSYDEWEGIENILQNALLADEIPGVLPQTLDMQVLDVKASSVTTLVALLSHTAAIPSKHSRSFAIVTISFAGKQIVVENIAKLSRNADPDLRPKSQPALVLAQDTAFVVFPDCVVIKTASYEELVTLKQADRARFLGFGLEGRNLSLVTVTSGVLKIEAFRP